MTDPAVYARLDGLQAALSRPTPPPLDGQEAIDLTPAARYEQPTLDESVDEVT